MKARTHTGAPATLIDLIEDLEEKGVRHLPTLESLQTDQIAMLARFARNHVPEAEWGHLQGCDGSGCPHEVCSTACHFGERHRFLKLVAEAYDLFERTGLPLWFVTLIEPRHKIEEGELGTALINAMQQSLRRRLNKVEARYGRTLVIGAIEASFGIEQDGSVWWEVHVHFVIAVDASKERLRELLRLRRRYPKGYRPVVVKEVYELANIIAYCVKRHPARRRAVVKDGRQDRDKDPARGRQLLEYDLWLLRQQPMERLFLRGMKRVHERLTLIS